MKKCWMSICAKSEEEEEEFDAEVDGKEEKKSLKQSLDTLQNTLLEFQEGCGLVASYLERISNMAHFEEVPGYTYLYQKDN